MGERWRQAATAALLAGLMAVVAWLPAVAGVVSTTSYRSHPVAGTTPKAVLAYMNAHPIIDPDDGPAYANLTHDHDLSVATRPAGGACRVGDVTLHWRFVITLPKAVDYSRMDGSTKSMWNAFAGAVRRHEETHRAIFLGCAGKFVPAAEALTASSCPELERKVRRSIDRAYDACMAAQRDFERRDRPHVLGLAFVKAAGR